MNATENITGVAGFHAERPSGSLNVRDSVPEDQERFDALLKEDHYLGPTALKLKDSEALRRAQIEPPQPEKGSRKRRKVTSPATPRTSPRTRRRKKISVGSY